MRKIFLAFILTLVILPVSFTGIQQSFGQEIGNEELDDEKPVYWFYVNLRILSDKQTGYEKYIVKRLGSQVFHGNINDYDRELWKNLGGGSKMAIGPFYEFEEARQALQFYDFSKPNDQRVIADMIDKNKDVYFFVLRVEKRPRSGAYLLRRIPGAVASGNAKAFDDMLAEGLDQKRLAIGPFWSQPEAEEAKRRYRLSGKDQ